MLDRTDVANTVYVYDGSYEGFLCGIFAAFERRETPVKMVPEEALEPMLFDRYDVETDFLKAERVSRGLYDKISAYGAQQVQYGFLSCMDNKEVHLLRYIRFGMQVGAAISRHLTEPIVDKVEKAVQQVRHEAHLYTGFVRFQEINRVLAAEIEPKSFVLPILAGHFCDRYPMESFVIVDKTHNMALAYSNGKKEIFPFDTYELPAMSDKEREIQALWKRFYDTIAIEGRINPKCRRSHMPKRFWNKLTELKDGDNRRNSMPCT